MKNYYIVFFLFVCQGFVVAQQPPTKLPDTISVDSITTDTLLSSMQYLEIDYENIQLPPVSVFLEAAKSYSDVKYYEQRQREIESVLKVSKKEWLKYIRLQGSYQYGTNNTYLMQTGEINPNDPRFTTSTQNWYNVGAIVSIPLDDLFSRKNKNDVYRSQMEQSKYELERALENRQIIILEAYNEVTKQLTLLKMNAESVALYDAQMPISERDFANGRIDIIALSLERARRTEANVRYQTSRASLHNAVTILEMLTKVKILR
ncbi:TolC family protein [Porphyromonadaceae bacterium]